MSAFTKKDIKFFFDIKNNSSVFSQVDLIAFGNNDLGSSIRQGKLPQNTSEIYYFLALPTYLIPPSGDEPRKKKEGRKWREKGKQRSQEKSIFK